MSNLYGAELAKVFDTMYQGFIDYNEEFQFYADKANLCNAQSIIEIGCGSGNLAKHFIKEFKSYLGLDLSDHMLELASNKNPTGQFLKADMRSFEVEKKFEMALITGRTSSYLLSPKDLTHTFDSISQTLLDKGHLVFDCIDAEKFVPFVIQNPKIIHHSSVGEMKFSRSTNWYIENQKENLINWKADYYKIKASEKSKLGNDNVIIKTFTRKEVIALLKKSGYVILSIEDRLSYAFDTFVVHAQKVN